MKQITTYFFIICILVLNISCVSKGKENLREYTIDNLGIIYKIYKVSYDEFYDSACYHSVFFIPIDLCEKDVSLLCNKKKEVPFESGVDFYQVSKNGLNYNEYSFELPSAVWNKIELLIKTKKENIRIKLSDLNISRICNETQWGTKAKWNGAGPNPNPIEEQTSAEQDGEADPIIHGNFANEPQQ